MAERTEQSEMVRTAEVEAQAGPSARVGSADVVAGSTRSPILGRTGAPLELLAPAGGPEQLEYAIRFGADAVYLATGRFGMRKRAANFTPDDLPRAVAYAHERGVAVHVACNVVMNDSDLADLASYLELVDRSGADALIVADLGAMRLARRHAPHLSLHVSTQASVANAEAALAWRELGASRIVCAREMSVAQIAAMRATVPDDLELEAFVHGSMCMAYSGRCLVSDFLNGRSANEGNCTQPCRWAWELREPSRPGQVFGVEEDGEATYLFNSRDLNMIEYLGDLAAAGVDSVKLEGRGRKAFYTATVVGAYRRAIDGEPAADVAPELLKVSHRPYSTGFYYGPASQAPASDSSDSDWIWVAEVTDARPADRGEAEGLGRWEVEVVARNRFDCESELEVLSPGRPTRRLRISDLQWVCEGDEAEDEAAGDDGELAGESEGPAAVPPFVVPAEPVACANRQMERYRFLSDIPLEPRDIVRAHV